MESEGGSGVERKLKDGRVSLVVIVAAHKALLYETNTGIGHQRDAGIKKKVGCRSL